MPCLARLRILGRDFLNERRGSMPIEGIMASTFLLWFYVASFQIFDAFRQKNVNLKASYTIADVVSRVQSDAAIDAGYVDGLNRLFDFLTFSNRPTWVRVSSVIWNSAAGEYQIAWSYGSGNIEGQTNASIQNYKDRIPNLLDSNVLGGSLIDGDSVIVVETNMAYEPIFNIGITAHWYRNFIPTRPRFASCVKFDRHDGAVPACIYDSDIDLNGNIAIDGPPDPFADTGG